MNTPTYTINPETGRRILVGGALFCQLVYDHYDYLNGDLVRRDTPYESETRGYATEEPPRKYYYNTTEGGQKFPYAFSLDKT